MAPFKTSRSLLAVLILLTLAPGALEAQRRGRGTQAAPTGDWRPISIGIHGGYDNTSQATMLGAQIRAPVVRSGKIEIMPSGSITFVTGLREYQFNLDAVYFLAGRAGGLYVAGGLAARNTIYPFESDRETKTGAGVAVGLRSMGNSRMGAHVEVRRVFVDPQLRPTAITVGLNLLLWGG